MWLKDYGINIGETIQIDLTRVYRNKNGKLVANATTQTDFQEIQFNIKEEYANTPLGIYNLTCNNKGNNGFPYIELNKEDNLSALTGQHNESKEDSVWSNCNTFLETEITKTKQEIQELQTKLDYLENINKEWKLK